MKPAARPFLLALALSMAAHGWVVVGVEWHLPEAANPIEVNFDARLSPERREPRSVRVSRPAPAANQVFEAAADPTSVAPPAPLPVEPAATPPAIPAAPVKSAQAEPPAALAPAQSTPNFPRQSRLAFSVFRGERGLLIGHCVQTWRSDGTTYRIESHTTAAGVAALFKTVKLTQTSEGTLDEAGLRPRHFRTERDGKPTEEARFSWESGLLGLRSGDTEREEPLTPGAQDVLSLFYQTALTWRGDETISLNVATGKRFNTYRLIKVGEAALPTRLGRLATVHLKREAGPGEDGIEIWLGRDVAWLPVRIRFTDRKGDVYDQWVEDIEIDGTTPHLPPPGKAQADEPVPAPG